VLGHEIALWLTQKPDDELVHGLGRSIEAVASAYGLKPGEAPSTTVSIVSWTSESVAALVLIRRLLKDRPPRPLAGAASSPAWSHLSGLTCLDSGWTHCPAGLTWLDSPVGLHLMRDGSVSDDP